MSEPISITPVANEKQPSKIQLTEHGAHRKRPDGSVYQPRSESSGLSHAEGFGSLSLGGDQFRKRVDAANADVAGVADLFGSQMETDVPNAVDPSVQQPAPQQAQQPPQKQAAPVQQPAPKQAPVAPQQQRTIVQAPRQSQNVAPQRPKKVHKEVPDHLRCTANTVEGHRCPLKQAQFPTVELSPGERLCPKHDWMEANREDIETKRKLKRVNDFVEKRQKRDEELQEELRDEIQFVNESKRARKDIDNLRKSNKEKGAQALQDALSIISPKKN